MALNKLKSAFVGSVLAASAAVLPLTGNPALADGAKAAATDDQSETNTFDQRREMRRYSEKPETQGIGVFINLQANAPEGYGDNIGKKLQGVFGTRDIPLEYRTNQSLGTATDITFYVKGIPFTIGIPDINKDSLGQILAHHNGAWLPERAASLSPQISQ